jgi:hypothetical protein
MTSQTQDMQAVLERLEKLERQNWRLKQVGLLIVGLLALIFLTAQSPRTKVLEANSFVLRDANGKTRATLDFWDNGFYPCLTFFDQQGKETAKFSEVMLELGSQGGTEKGGVQIARGGAYSAINMFGQGKTHISLTVDGDEAYLRTSDPNGFQTVLGNTDLVSERTGESHKTSAASLVMFDKGAMLSGVRPNRSGFSLKGCS